jgi:hypothetical protein
MYAYMYVRTYVRSKHNPHPGEFGKPFLYTGAFHLGVGLRMLTLAASGGISTTWRYACMRMGNWEGAWEGTCQGKCVAEYVYDTYYARLCLHVCARM